MQLQILSLEDAKNALREVLRESTPIQPPSEPEQYIYGLKELADFLGVGITTAWKLKNSGKIIHYTAGKKIIFKQSEVLSALKRKGLTHAI